MARVQRFDIGGLEKPVKLPNGWVRVDAYLARTGVQRYLTQDGKERLEYRPPDEVFNADSLASFSAVPFTNDHPPEVLDATNTQKYQRGHLDGAPTQDGDRMRARILVTDAATIAAMNAGKLEISNGYFCDLEEVPGTTPEGQRYDAVQRSIVGNHVALVTTGRAGPEVRARMDSASAIQIDSKNDPIPTESAQGKSMTTRKVKFDAVEVDVDETVATHIEKDRTDAQAKIDALAAEMKNLQAKADADAARADAAEKSLADTKLELVAAPEKVKAAMTARAKLEAIAKAVCGAEAKTDGVEDKELRKAIAATQAGDVKLDDKSDAYLDALVDLAVKKLDEAAAKATTNAKSTLVETPADKKPSLYEVAAAQFKAKK